MRNYINMKESSKNTSFNKSQSQNNSKGKNIHFRNNNSSERVESSILSLCKNNVSKNSLKNTKCSSPLKIDLNSGNNSQINFHDYIYDKTDCFDDLIKKNEKLRILVIQANNKINDLIEKQKENENDYKLEKKSILQQLEKIQKNYKLYANSHKSYNDIKGKLDKLISNYNILNENYFNAKNEYDSILKDYYSIYEQISHFIENNYEKNNIHQLSFEFILHLKKNIYENYKTLSIKTTPSSSIQTDLNTKPNLNNHSNKIPNGKSYNYKKKFNNNLNPNEFKHCRSKSPSFSNLYQKKVIRQNSNSNLTTKSEANDIIKSKLNLNENIYSNFNCFKL